MLLLFKILIMLTMLIKYILLFINKLNLNLNKKTFFNSIECGFNQMNNKHLPLYNNFFIILIIFLIFDLEFFLIMPSITMIKNLNWKKNFMLIILTILFIYFSMMYEIKMNCINWIK